MSVGGLRQILTRKAYDHFLKLNQNGRVIATYIWIDGTGETTRSKSMCLKKRPYEASELSTWNFDGSSTGQAVGRNSDTFMVPRAICPDPLLGGDNVLVLTDVYDYKMRPVATNNRNSCKKAMDAAKHLKPWFGIEQEYTMLGQDGHPLEWPKNGFPGPQGPYYCGVGFGKVYGREIVEAHLKACMYADLEIGGINAEVMPSSWEYQIGPCEGMKMGDQMWFSRYLLDRIAEDFGVVISYDPKPMPGDWNGAGAHCNFSTEEMRTPGVGMKVIKDAIKKLSKRHMEHIRRYDPKGGEDNKRRLTGLYETAPIDQFSSGVAHRGASIRIPRQAAADGYGYLEDRRPSSNCDPYSVIEMLVRTICLDE